MSGPAAGCAWVTGAGRGIGAALCLELARRGWRVAGSARTVAELEATAARAADLPGEIVPFPLDVTDAAATAAVIDAVEARWGGIDLAVLNAGIGERMSAAAFSGADFRRVIEVNLMGAVHGLDAVLPRMIARRGGRIGVVASLAGYRGMPGALPYGASKAALINLCEALMPDARHHGVGLSVINPGFVRTAMTDRNDFDMPLLMESDKAARRIADGLAAGRFEIVFPRRMALIMKIVRLLPNALYLRLSRRLVR